jgi:Flp pilus assembly CpaF family ATPase
VGLPELSGDERELVSQVAELFRESSGGREVKDRPEARAEIERLLHTHCDKEGMEISAQQLDYLVRAALSHVYGFSAIDYMLDDAELEEIAIVGIGPDKPAFVFHRRNGWMKTDFAFTSAEAFVEIVNKMARALGRRITLQSPRINAMLPDGSRMHATIPPLSGHELTIRKFRSNPITIADLCAYKTYSAEALAFLWAAMQADCSVLIAGNTASGKTSTLNALFQFVPLRERVLVTEETPEISLPHENLVKLLASEEVGINMGALVADSLRMRPDRVVVGEARTAEEAKALMETMASGQARGSYATFHSQSAREALLRLRALGVMPADMASLDLIVVQRRMMRYNAKADGKGRGREVRRCVEISEVVPKFDEENAKVPEVARLFTYDTRKDKLMKNAGENTKTSRVMEKISDCLGMSVRELSAELKRRAEFIASLQAERPFADITAEIQRFAYGAEEAEVVEARKPKPMPGKASFFDTVLQ